MLSHQSRAFFIEKRTVLDGRNAGAHGYFDSFCAVRMRCYFPIQLVSFVNHSFQFFKRVLSYTDSVSL